jgi:hypothetical protein
LAAAAAGVAACIPARGFANGVDSGGGGAAVGVSSSASGMRTSQQPAETVTKAEQLHDRHRLYPVVIGQADAET